MSLPPSPSGRALVVVGEAPGYHEDISGKSWVGPAGQTLEKLYLGVAFGLSTKADVYLSNAVRCRPPKNDTPTKSQIKACRPYLLADLQALSSIYKEVWVLCCGAVAAQALGFKSLKDAISHQGTWKEITE